MQNGARSDIVQLLREDRSAAIGRYCYTFKLANTIDLLLSTKSASVSSPEQKACTIIFSMASTAVV